MTLTQLSPEKKFEKAIKISFVTSSVIFFLASSEFRDFNIIRVIREH